MAKVKLLNDIIQELPLDIAKLHLTELELAKVAENMRDWELLLPHLGLKMDVAQIIKHQNSSVEMQRLVCECSG